MGDLRYQFSSELREENTDVLRAIPAAPYKMVSADREVMAVNSRFDDDAVINERKRVWADLDREQTEIKRDIKSLMKTEATSRVLEDPGLAERVSAVRAQPSTYDTAQDKATEKRMAE